jgi:L-threonylcarbamoyladenylate synthase
VHIANPEDAEQYAVTDECFYSLAKAFMPGPLTIILPKKNTIPKSVTGGLDTVAIRCPSHPVAQALINAAGVPIAAPSANISGKPSPTTASDVIEDMSGKIDCIIDGGDCEIGLESTIIKLDGRNATLLRPGAITPDALSFVCDNVYISPAVTEILKENERVISPGMKYRHYSPDTPLVLLEGDDDKVINFMREKSKTADCVLLLYTEYTPLFADVKHIDIGSYYNLPEQASRLFHSLRLADKQYAEIIYAFMPKKTGLGLALYNRLIRAATHTIIKL